MDIKDILRSLSSTRELFHSEADLQFTFSWMLNLKYPDAEIRLERPIQTLEGKYYLDLLVHYENEKIGFEFKYKTKKLSFNHNDEQYDLTDHAATNLGRYDFLKDIQRLENLKEEGLINKGYAIFLTNDSAYWNNYRDSNRMGPAFYIEEGAIKSGEMDWARENYPEEDQLIRSITKGRNKKINLNSSYQIEWVNFSEKLRFVDVLI